MANGHGNDEHWDNIFVESTPQTPWAVLINRHFWVSWLGCDRVFEWYSCRIILFNGDSGHNVYNAKNEAQITYTYIYIIIYHVTSSTFAGLQASYPFSWKTISNWDIPTLHRVKQVQQVHPQKQPTCKPTINFLKSKSLVPWRVVPGSL